MALKRVVAEYDCDGCASGIKIELNTGERLYKIGDGSLHDYAEEAFKGGHTLNHRGFASIEGDHHLCPKCTSVVDAWVEGSGKPDDYSPTYDEVRAALDDKHGV